jgi:hypothetical protein
MAPERLVIVRRPLGAAVAGGLHGPGMIDHGPEGPGVRFVDIEEVVHQQALSGMPRELAVPGTEDDAIRTA